MKRLDALIAVSLIVVTAHTSAAPPELRGQPPTAPVGTVEFISADSLSPDLKEILPKDASGRLKAGGGAWQEEQAQRFWNYRSYLKDGTAAHGKIKFELAKVDKSALAQFPYEGFVSGGPSRDGPWTDVTRVFTRPDGYAVFLLEFDFVAAGGSVTVIKELINAKVGDSPATLSVQRAGDGRAITDLSWQSKRKTYMLTTWGDLSEHVSWIHLQPSVAVGNC